MDEARCAACHPDETARWTGSDHDLAMDPATSPIVAADFSATFEKPGEPPTVFSERDGRRFVTTAGPDGRVGEHEITHVFGVRPLQQFLVPLGGGRLQALSVCWDVEGRRWFHLYPSEPIAASDELHWTKPSQNWNHMCAECHATDLRKGYDAASGTFRTTWARLDVGCQACHGPGSRHVAWADALAASGAEPDSADDPQLDVDLAAEDPNVVFETCARCHSRRGRFWQDHDHGGRLLDTHLPALLDEGLYHADGQIQDEVYEWGSYQQSRMFAKGVRCADCHDPHSLRTRAPGDDLCLRCHTSGRSQAPAHVDSTGLRPKDYYARSHHFHEPGKPGSHCVDCHAPAKTYMGVDPRRDHSFRIPRPDLAAALGTPDACTGCHADRGAQWCADAAATWWGPGRRQEEHFGATLDAGRRRAPDAAPRLAALAADPAQAPVVRATALDLLRGVPGPIAAAAWRRALSDPDPLVRRTAVAGFEGAPPQELVPALAPLADDPVRGVRIEAARLLAGITAAARDPNTAAPWARALAEYEASLDADADRPDAHLRRGNLRLAQGRREHAADAYRRALAIDPGFVPARVNLADLLGRGGDDAAAESLLLEGLRTAPAEASLHHALGLGRVRGGRRDEAVASLRRAAEADPGSARYAFVLAVALHETGNAAEAVEVLRRAAAAHPGDPDVLAALAGVLRAAGDPAGAADAEARLRTIRR